MATASLNKEMLGVDSTHYISKAVLSSGRNELDHISKKLPHLTTFTELVSMNNFYYTI
jgi:hypothetical protein